MLLTTYNHLSFTKMMGIRGGEKRSTIKSGVSSKQIKRSSVMPLFQERDAKSTGMREKKFGDDIFDEKRERIELVEKDIRSMIIT